MHQLSSMQQREAVYVHGSSDVQNSDQQATLEYFIELVGDVQTKVSQIETAMRVKKTDRFAPITFMNVDGSCFLQGATEMLFALKRIFQHDRRDARDY